MSSLPRWEHQLDLSITASELQRFEQYVREKYEIPELRARYRAVEAEQAMLEFIDEDPGAACEAILTALDRTLAHSSETYAECRISGHEQVIHSADLDREDLASFRPVVSKGVYEQFTAFVGELNAEYDTNLTLGEAMEVALRERREGGRKQRVADRGSDMLDALPDVDVDVEQGVAAVEVLDDESEDAAPAPEHEYEHPPNTEAGKLERIRQYVADQTDMTVAELYQGDGGELPKRYIDDAIDEYCTRTRDEATDRTRAKYHDKLAEDIGLVEHAAPPLYRLVDPSVLDQPAFEYKADEQLTRNERAERVAVEALKRSRKRYGRGVSADDIPALFDDRDEIPAAEAGKIRSVAADLPGISTAERGDGSTVLVANPAEADDALLISAGLLDPPTEQEAPEPDRSEPVSTAVDEPDIDAEPEPDEDEQEDNQKDKSGSEVEDEQEDECESEDQAVDLTSVEQRMDELVNATPTSGA